MRHTTARLLCGLLLAALTILAAPQAASARFLQPDTYDPFLAGVDTNRYAYCNNDPINCSDAAGHQGIGHNGGPELDGDRDGDGIPDDFDRRPDMDSRSIININPGMPADDRSGLGGLAFTGAASAIIAGQKRLQSEKSALRNFDDIPTIGTPQVTRGLAGPQHAARSENLARNIVSKYGAENVKSITYHSRLSTSVPGAMDGRLPDVVVELKSGDIVIGEVASGTQTRISQQDKLNKMRESLLGRNVSTAVDGEMAKDGPASAAEHGSAGGTGGGPDASGSSNRKSNFEH